MNRRGLFAALICVAACSSSKLGGGSDGGTAGTVGTGQGGAVGAGGDGAGTGGTGGDGTGGGGTAGSGTGGGGTAGSASGGRGGAIAAGGRGGSSSVVGDAGAGGPCLWTPPDAPDGGFSPPPPDAGRPADSKPACSYKSCSLSGYSTVPFDDASLGFTATDLLGKFANPTTAQLTWYDGTSTTLHFQMRYDQPVVHVWEVGDPGCGIMDVYGAVVSLTTDDGRLSGDDFRGRLSGNVLGPTTTFVWAGFGGPPVSNLHGSFRAPSTWGAVIEVQSLTVVLPARAETCSVCAASGDPSNPSFVGTQLGCEYDGKILWNGMVDPTRNCTPQVTVAAWQWSQ
jgi:hypothetical protein